MTAAAIREDGGDAGVVELDIASVESVAGGFFRDREPVPW